MRLLGAKLLLTNLALALLVGGGLIGAQQPEAGGAKKDAEPAKAPTLEELLAKAAKDNPDIRVAESKVREAEAELNRARLNVVQKVVKLHHEIAAHKALVTQARASLARALQLAASRAISKEEITAAQHALQQAQAGLAKAEAEMPYLLGKQPDATLRLWDVTVRSDARIVWDLGEAKLIVPPVAGTMADKIRKALDAPIKVQFRDTRLSDAVEYLRIQTGVNIHYAAKGKDDAVSVTFTEPVPLGALFQYLEDHVNVRFVVRDYGIVVSDPKHLPPGAMLLHDFWKSDPSKKTTAGPKN